MSRHQQPNLSTVPDAAEPEYFPATFPATGFPVMTRTAVTHEGRGVALPEHAWTTETTHRDGQQGGLPLSAATSMKIYDIQCRFTGSSGAIRQAEFFAYREADRRALEAALERWQGGAPIEPTTWIRASREDVERVRRIGVRETGMLASASDFHTFHKFKPGGRSAAAERYLAAVATALDAGLRPRLHLEDATRAPSAFLVPFVEAVLHLAEPYGEALRPKFRVCDTLGLGLPYEDAALPRSVPGRIRELRGMGLGAEDLEFHPHNDLHLVVANSLAAVRAGCAVVNGTCLGKGERSGNAPLEGVLVHLLGMGYMEGAGPDFHALNELVELYTEIGEPLPAKYPLFGRDAHRTRAGIHADGLNKFWWMYAPFDVPRLLGRPLEVSLTKDSGVAGVLFLLRQHLGLELAKTDPRVLQVAAWVAEQFDQGRTTGIEWEELEVVARQVFAPADDAVQPVER